MIYSHGVVSRVRLTWHIPTLIYFLLILCLQNYKSHPITIVTLLIMAHVCSALRT